MKGYVRKRGNKWSYTVDVGRDAITGKRKQKTKGGFGSEKEAEKALNEVIYEFNKGLYIEPQKILFKDFANEWFDNYKYNLRGTTSEQYQSKIKKWLIPILGNYKIQELKPIHAQMLSKKLLEAFNSANTAHKVYSIAKLIMKHAVNLEVINKNPLDNITVKKDKNEITTWTFDELDHFLDIVKKHDSFYHAVFVVAAYTGLRKGEVLGLSRLNVDLEKNFILINQSVAETKEKGVYIDRVKTPSSVRKVAIDSSVTSILKEQIKKNNAMKLKLGKEYQDNGLVLCHLDGKIFRPSSLNRPFRKYIELSGVPYIRFHDMRHTHATLLLELNVNPKIISDRLGHSSVKITLDTYSHPSLDMQTSAAEVFAKRAKNS